MPQLAAFVRTWEQEFQTTLRVFSSYPSDRLAYRPHEKSRTAHALMWTIATEGGDIINGWLRGNIPFRGEKPPKTKEALWSEYKKRHRALVTKVRRAGEELFSRTIRFYLAKGKMGDVKVCELLLETL